jgi:hypothetical protein
MVEITLSHPSPRHPNYQVFAAYEGPDDRYTFGFQEFSADAGDRAEQAARTMIFKFRADKFRRVAG